MVDHIKGTEAKNKQRGVSKKLRHIVGVGASAGGLDALKALFKPARTGSGMAFVVIQHLAPGYESALAGLLAHETALPVSMAEEGVLVEADHIYVISPGAYLLIEHGVLVLKDRTSEYRNPVDLFFQSLAIDKGAEAVGIILTGAGDDGLLGCKAIKEAGGVVIAQAPEEAAYDLMPSHVIEAERVDLVLPANKMWAELMRFQASQLIGVHMTGVNEFIDQNSDIIQEIVNYLKKSARIDVSKYKLPTITRRIERRVGILALSSFKEYYAYLLNNKEEPTLFIGDMLIGVTHFFRDKEVFERIAHMVVPAVLESNQYHDEIRVWVAGCASGEEAYSIAILFEEAARKQKHPKKVKIFATDVNPESIAKASAGHYSDLDVQSVTKERLKRFFIEDESGYTVVPELRQKVVFAVHDLLSDPPFSNIQLVVCRNVLIYFKQDTQSRVLAMLHFSLHKGGYLVLGGAESLGNLSGQFSAVDEKKRIYYKQHPSKPSSYMASPLPGSNHNGEQKTGGAHTVLDYFGKHNRQELSSNHLAMLGDKLIETYAPPCIILNKEQEVLHVYGDVSPYTRKLKSGRFSANIGEFIVEDLSLAVSTAIFHAVNYEEDVKYDQVHFVSEAGSPIAINLSVRYFDSSATAHHCPLLAVLFELVERTVAKEDGGSIAYNIVEQSYQRVKDLEVQLKAKQERQQVAVEELESTNEELQSSNEELLAANEEMQGTNEELHSVNEELYTVNGEFQEKIEEVTRVNTDIDNMMNSIKIGIVLLDESMTIRSFTRAATKEIRLLPSDVGRPFHHIAHSMYYDTFLKDISEVIENQTTIEKEVLTKSNTVLKVKLLPYLNNRGLGEGCVVMFDDVTEAKQLEGRLNEAYRAFRETSGSVLLHEEHSLKVLVIDDNEVDLNTVDRMLKDPSLHSQYEVHVAKSLETVVATLSSERFDVCLIDYYLGVENAVNLIKHLPKGGEWPPFILISGNVSPIFSKDLLALGIYDAVDKASLSPPLLERMICYTVHQRNMERRSL